jgi:serine/threonine protein kinase
MVSSMNEGDLIQGRYVLESPLGTGGMAEVWCARDQRMERQVAVKFLSPLLIEEPEFLVRFFSEAQSVAKINHPSVVAILDFGEHEDRPYLVMEHMDGGSLADLVGQPLLPEATFEMVAAAARGAGAAHHAGLVHRDVKPANILLDKHCGAKIADFGIASSRAAERLTATGAAIGSPHYISPEQVSAAEVTPRSDVYSFGIVLFELLTGQKPFDADNVTAIAISHVDKEPPVPSSINPDLSPAVDAIVLRCLAKDPAERYANGDELADALENYDEGAPVIAAGPDLTDEDDFEPTDNSRRVLVGTTLILLLLGLATAGVLAANRSEAPQDAEPFAFATAAPGKPKNTGSPSPSASPTTLNSAPVAASSPTPSPSPTEEEKKKKDGGTTDEDPEPTPESEPTPTPEPTPEPTTEPSPAPSASAEAETSGTEG